MNAAARRRFLIAAGALLAFSAAAAAQQPGRIFRVGVLSPRPREDFRQGLLEHGWIEGKNIIIEHRTTDGTPKKIVDAARELSALKVDCIVAAGNPTITALKQSVPGIPVVMAFAADVVGSGLVASLRRPGGNITGLTNINEALTGKRLELLKTLNSRISRVAVLKSPAITAHEAIWKEAESSARSLGFRVLAVDYRSGDDLEAAFAAITRERVEGLLVPASPAANSVRERILSFAAKGRLPGIFQNSSWVEAGGLMSYSPDETDMWRRSAAYVDKILKGARPGDLPVEQPTKFELIVNMRTARTLGITIPQTILVRADWVIE